MDNITEAIQILHSKKRILVIAGAGIATSAGVPDFRSSDGIFAASGGRDSFDANLVWRTLQDQQDFYALICNIYARAQQALRRKPSPTYQLLQLLRDRGSLHRLYTQNIDNIDVEHLGGTEVPPSSTAPWPTVIQLHGSVNHALCTFCNTTMTDYNPQNFLGGQETCPTCAQRAASRTSKHPALRSIQPQGTLRPRVVLYNGPNPDEPAILKCVHHDNRARPDAIVVIGTRLSIAAIQRMVFCFCDGIRARKGVTIWVSNEQPAQRIAPYFDYILQDQCDNVTAQWMRSLREEPSQQQQVHASKQPIHDDDDAHTGQLDRLEVVTSLSSLVQCIRVIAGWLSNTCRYCGEGNDYNAPYLHARPLSYADAGAYKTLEKSGVTNLAQGDIFSAFFKQAAQSRHHVRIGLFTTCTSNAVELRQQRGEALGSIWAFILIAKKQDERKAILIFDPRNQLCNEDGTFRSATRKLRSTCEAAVAAYTKYARVTKSVEVWHSKGAAEGDYFQAVRELLDRFILKGDKALEKDDERLADFIKVRG